MDLKDILTISGYKGLFKYISQGRNGIIVEGLEDKKRMNVFSNYKVSSLKDIAIFTDEGELILPKVFKLIYDKENGLQISSDKLDEKKIKAYFEQILPNYDKEKVYVSHIKKILTWYNILINCGITEFEEEEKNSDNSSGEEVRKEDNKK